MRQERLSFLDRVPLPDYDGQPLAVTGTRALERFSDLVDGGQAPARLRMEERFDVMDECLDLVVPRVDLPAGFEFTGMSLAEFWANLLTVHSSGPLIEQWRASLGGKVLDGLREAARKRVAIRPSQCFLHSRSLRLPHQYQDVPRVLLPDVLANLKKAALPDWTPGERSRVTVETLSWHCKPGRKMPSRGRRTPARVSNRSVWVRWMDQRMRHQRDDDYNYFEVQLALPSLETSYFTDHFGARNVFAHLRMTLFQDREGRSVLLLDEVQSDWLRDLRLQRQGKPVKRRPVVKGVSREQPVVDIPPCPVAEHWLELALYTFLDFADDMGCDAVAWVPAVIQCELNPPLPLNVAQALYDRNVPDTLSRLVEGKHQRATVDYPTYRRDVRIGYRSTKGWRLVGPDYKTPLSEPVQEREAILSLFGARATPVVEQLPALMLDPEPPYSCLGVTFPPPGPWQLDKLEFRPSLISAYITEAVPTGWHLRACKAMDDNGEHIVKLGPMVNDKDRLILFETAADLINALKALFDEHSVRLDYVTEGMRGFGGHGVSFAEEMHQRGVAWARQDPIEGKDTSVIPAGNHCNGCPYRTRREDMPAQENGYCAYLEWGDWMSVACASNLWDGVKRCGVNRDDVEES